MKGQALHITFHNPNTEAETQHMAKEFITRAVSETFFKILLENEENHTPTFLATPEDPLQ